jgi:uncharacterized alpha-E superfamily protein
MSDLFTDQAYNISSGIDEKSAKTIGRSRMFVLCLINRLYEDGKKTTTSNITRIILQNLKKRNKDFIYMKGFYKSQPIYRKEFYLMMRIGDFLETSDKSQGIIEHINGRTDLGYRLTKDGKKSLEHFASKIK